MLEPDHPLAVNDSSQLRPVANPWVQSSGRLLYFGSCRKANSHYSAEAVVSDLSELRLPRIAYWMLPAKLSDWILFEGTPYSQGIAKTVKDCVAQ